MARAGLGKKWQCLLANDLDPKKAAAYSENWGESHLLQADISTLEAQQLPKKADLAWASFPCQDLSLAGLGAGLQGKRSSTFWPFWDLIKALKQEQRAPSLIVLENVCGALSSHEGQDFMSICTALNESEYHFGAMIIDAVHFVPQSRPRLFILAVSKESHIPKNLISSGALPTWHPQAIRKAYNQMPEKLKANWIWWNLPKAPERKNVLADLIEDEPTGTSWHSEEETQRLLSMMTPLNREKVTQAQQSNTKIVGTLYRRTRPDADGHKVQRAEVRFDGVAGCLRTPGGGSSRQTIVVVEKEKIRTRLLSTREAARLMGLPESYKLPQKYNEAYHLIGDGLAVPAVRFLAENLLNKIINHPLVKNREAA